MSSPSSSLKAEILEEISSRGAIPFARFMELCLYHPEHGYYSRGAGGGGGRDYMTSSGIHRAFGTLVARQAEEMWIRCGRPERFGFVEFGPGEGWFARDFVNAAAGTAPFARALHYRMVEPSPVLKARQRARLEGRSPVRMEWVSEEHLESAGRFVGCLFANEVLDAFPVHRVVGTPDGPREIHVGERDGDLVETRAPLSSEGVGRFLYESGISLEDGQEVDLNLAAPCWIRWALGLLERGYAMIVDYGFEAHELYSPARRRGTLLTYYQHKIGEDFLERPGDQDLTAHVDFSALSKAAVVAGGRRLGLVTQSRFLLSLGALDFMAADPVRPPEDAGEYSTRRSIHAIRDREALKELILPQRMGERFNVLLIGVGEVSEDLSGLRAPWEKMPAAGRTERGERVTDPALK